MILFEQVTQDIEMTHMHCGECDCHFYVDKNKYDRCKANGEAFWCPNGHERIFTKSKVKELEQQVKSLESTNTYLRTAKDNLHNQLTDQKHITRAHKAATTRIKNRVKHGVCPCCNRSFKQLADHMKTQHPDYVKDSK